MTSKHDLHVHADTMKIELCIFDFHAVGAGSRSGLADESPCARGTELVAVNTEDFRQFVAPGLARPSARHAFTDSLARPTDDEQNAIKITAFDLQMNPAARVRFRRSEIDRAAIESSAAAATARLLPGSTVIRLELTTTRLSMDPVRQASNEGCLW